MDTGLVGKTALVLGAGGGLGSVVAAHLADEGASVAAADVNEAAIGKTVERILANGNEAIGLCWDLSSLDIIDSQISRIEEKFGSVDILVSFTGGPPPGTAEGQKIEIWRKYFDSMVLPVFAVADRVLPNMKKGGWGRIITSTSSGVIAPIPNLGISNSLRSALVGWSKTLASEVASSGITVNTVVPGRIATERIVFLDEQKAKREGKSVEETRADSLSMIPAARYGEPAEFADVVTFLASKRASYVTGTMIRVDGGYLANV